MSEPPRKRMVKPPSGGLEEGRTKAARLKTAKDRTPSQQAWLNRQINDPFAAKARAHGYRSRAAYKLTEIDDRLKLLKPGARIIDLGLAPGGWTQVAMKRGAAAVVGVDLLPVEPVPGATLIEADFTAPGVDQQLIDLLGGPPDLVLSDMEHNTVGHRQTDHLKIIVLIEIAADFAIRTLKPGGAFVTKSFQGGDLGEVMGRLRAAFDRVQFVKPGASRNDSAEVFLAATGKRLAKPTSAPRF